MPKDTESVGYSPENWQAHFSRKDQEWIADRFASEGGLETFFPEAMPWLIEKGFRLSDLDRAFDDAKTARMGVDELVKVGDYLNALADEKAEQGLTVSAAELYHRTALCYIQGSWGIKDAQDETKQDWHSRGLNAYDRLIEHHPHYSMEKVEIGLPFSDEPMSAVFHKCGDESAPTVLFVPGLDMAKEEYPNPFNNRFVHRGMNVLSIDGPGQGETRLRGVAVDEHGKYQRAGRAAIDWLVERPEVDSERIGVFGISNGSYWGGRITYEDDRVSAFAAYMGSFYYKDYNTDTPQGKKRYMYVSGITDEAEFDEYLKGRTIEGMEDGIHVPTFIAHGEYDEKSPLEFARRFYERIDVPKELHVYENEFHPIGGSALEVIYNVSDWFVRVWDGAIEDDHELAILEPDYPSSSYIPSREYEFLRQGRRP